MNLQEFILHQNTRDVCHHSLLSEACHSAIEVGAFLQLHALDDDIIQQFEAESGSLMGFGGLVYHGLNQRIIQFLFVSHGIEIVCILGVSLGDNSYRVLLWLLVGIDGIAIDIIAGNLTTTIRIGLVLGITIGSVSIIARNITCHLPASLLDLAHLLLKLLHLPLLTAVTATTVTGIAVIILVDMHP